MTWPFNSPLPWQRPGMGGLPAVRPNTSPATFAQRFPNFGSGLPRLPGPQGPAGFLPPPQAPQLPVPQGTRMPAVNPGGGLLQSIFQAIGKNVSPGGFGSLGGALGGGLGALLGTTSPANEGEVPQYIKDATGKWIPNPAGQGTLFNQPEPAPAPELPPAKTFDDGAFDNLPEYIYTAPPPRPVELAMMQNDPYAPGSSMNMGSMPSDPYRKQRAKYEQQYRKNGGKIPYRSVFKDWALNHSAEF